MRNQFAGDPVYTLRTRRGVSRRHGTTPKWSGRYWWTGNPWWVLMEWRMVDGYRPLTFWDSRSGWPGTKVTYPEVGAFEMKRPNVAGPEEPDENTPAAVSVVLKKFPRMLAFLTDRRWDDGEPRLPGSIWMDCDFGGMKAMLKEPDLMLCARIRAATVDDLYAAVELFLGLDSPPWEIDQYAMKRAPKKRKKK